MFSTPMQQMRSGGMVRGVSGGAALVAPPPPQTRNVGGGAGASMARSGLSGDIASLNPFVMPPLPQCIAVPGGFIPPMPAPMPPVSRQIAVDYTHNRPSPIEIPPPPSIEELEEEHPDPGYTTPRDQIRTVDPSNPPPAPIRAANGEPSPKRARVTFQE
jgi:hypothetical protein